MLRERKLIVKQAPCTLPSTAARKHDGDVGPCSQREFQVMIVEVDPIADDRF